MEDILMSIIGIITASVLLFIFPLMLISDSADDISQLTSQTAVNNFVDEVIKSGKITTKEYVDLNNILLTTGNSYEIEIELRILDFNTAQTYTTNNGLEIGDNNTYYSIYTSQIEDKLRKSDLEDDKEYNDTGVLILKEGDGISVTVKNSSATLSQSLRNIYYKATGEDMHIILSTASFNIQPCGSPSSKHLLFIMQS